MPPPAHFAVVGRVFYTRLPFFEEGSLQVSKSPAQLPNIVSHGLQSHIVQLDAQHTCCSVSFASLMVLSHSFLHDPYAVLLLQQLLPEIRQVRMHLVLCLRHRLDVAPYDLEEGSQGECKADNADDSSNEEEWRCGRWRRYYDTHDRFAKIREDAKVD